MTMAKVKAMMSMTMAMMFKVAETYHDDYMGSLPEWPKSRKDVRKEDSKESDKVLRCLQKTQKGSDKR